ncbi:MAG TPA: hypothetical protein VFV87_03065 [Pirellulaceae bacterium]|nr:hypothetical protein [Pirellulaceae bacterium]
MNRLPPLVQGAIGLAGVMAIGLCCGGFGYLLGRMTSPATPAAKDEVQLRATMAEADRLIAEGRAAADALRPDPDYQAGVALLAEKCPLSVWRQLNVPDRYAICEEAAKRRRPRADVDFWASEYFNAIERFNYTAKPETDGSVTVWFDIIDRLRPPQ